MINQRTIHLLLLLALSTISSGMWWILKGGNINGDEAVIGLMALKISHGVDFPFFFWQAHYGGPIASYLSAPLHWLWEPSGWVLHAILIPMHITFVIGIYLTAQKWLKEESAFVAAIFTAMPFSLFPYSPLGGYTESLVILPWIVYLFFGLDDTVKLKTYWRYFGGGILNGFALWVFPISVPMILVSFFYLYRETDRNKGNMALLGFAFALIPMIYYNLKHPAGTFLRLFSRPLHADKQTFIGLLRSDGILHSATNLAKEWFSSAFHSLLNLPQFVLSLMGLSANESYWLEFSGIISLVALVLALWFCLGSQARGRTIPRVWGAMVITNIAYVVLFGMQRDRYLIPLLVLIPFGLSIILTVHLNNKGKYLRYFIIPIILFMNCLSNYTGSNQIQNNYSEFAKYLETKGMRTGYADYFTAYPITYLSNERLIFTPVFNTPESDRYALYTQLVSESRNPVFIFYDNSTEVIPFKEKMRALEVHTDEQVWQNYRIFSNLSPLHRAHRLPVPWTGDYEMVREICR